MNSTLCSKAGRRVKGTGEDAGIPAVVDYEKLGVQPFEDFFWSNTRRISSDSSATSGRKNVDALAIQESLLRQFL